MLFLHFYLLNCCICCTSKIAALGGWGAFCNSSSLSGILLFPPSLVLCANLISILPIPSFKSFTQKKPHTTTTTQPVTHTPPVAVLTNRVPSENMKSSSREPLVCPGVQRQICWSCLCSCQSKPGPAARGAVHLCDVKEHSRDAAGWWEHTVPSRQNTFRASVIDCLCNNHTPPDSFFRKKKTIRLEQMGADQNRLHRAAAA